MSANSVNLRQKFVVLFIILSLIGLLGILSNVSGEEAGEYPPEVSEESRGSRAPITAISGFFQLWDDNYYEPHDGSYDEDDGYYYYLDTTRSFYVVLKNRYENGYLKNIQTTLRRGTGVGSVITITDPYYNYTYSTYEGWEGYFYFTLRTSSNAMITAYELALDVDFTEVDSSSNEFNRSGTLKFTLKLSSRLRSSGGWDEFQLVAKNKYDETVDLYSGAKNQIIAFRYPYSASNTLDDVSVTLHLPSSFVVDSNSITREELRTYSSYNTDLEWLLTDAGSNDATAQKVYGNLDINYKIDGKSITEKQVQIMIEIVPTPMINLDGQISEIDIGTLSGGKLLSNVEIYQGTTSESFSLKFKNDGNVNLKDVKVELFTDNAAFFFKSNFYYDENYYAYKRAYGKTVELGDIDSGSSVTKDFSAEIIKNLPPGLYKIPIKYWIKYNPGGLLDIELDEGDFHSDITAQRSGNTDDSTPYLILQVLEGDDGNDNTEPDLQAISSATLRPGMHNVQLSVELTNLENYRLNNVNVKINAGGTSPLQQLNEIDRTEVEIDAQEKDFIMYGANDGSFSNKYTIHFLVDVYKDAAVGVQEVPITVTCLDPFNQERSTIVKVPLNINPIPPSCVISDIITSKIKPNKDFDLTVKVYNCGGSEAKYVRVMFNGSSNLFSAKESIQGPNSIKKNEEFEFKFNIRAGEVDPGNTYTSSVFVSFEDPLGNDYPFNSNPDHKITLRVDKAEDEDQLNIDVGLALVILALFILISTIIFSVLRSRLSKREKRAMYEAGVEVRSPPPTEKGVQQFGRKEGKAPKMEKGAKQRPPQEYQPTPTVAPSTGPPTTRPPSQPRSPPPQRYPQAPPRQPEYQPPPQDWQAAQMPQYPPSPPPPGQRPRPGYQPYGKTDRRLKYKAPGEKPPPSRPPSMYLY